MFFFLATEVGQRMADLILASEEEDAEEDAQEDEGEDEDDYDNKDENNNEIEEEDEEDEDENSGPCRVRVGLVVNHPPSEDAKEGGQVVDADEGGKEDDYEEGELVVDENEGDDHEQGELVMGHASCGNQDMDDEEDNVWRGHHPKCLLHLGPCFMGEDQNNSERYVYRGYTMHPPNCVNHTGPCVKCPCGDSLCNSYPLY